MSIFVELLVVAGALFFCSWLVFAYWQFRLYRQLHKKLLVMFKVMDQLSVKERYKVILARDSACQKNIQEAKYITVGINRYFGYSWFGYGVGYMVSCVNDAGMNDLAF